MELGFGSSLLVRFQAGRCPEINNVVTAALLPHQPDQLRRGHDRYDNGERAIPLDVPQRNGTKPKFFNDFSRACMSAPSRGRPCDNGGLLASVIFGSKERRILCSQL
jgi:hypothetical protein